MKELVEEPVEQPVKELELSEPVEEPGLSGFIEIADLSSPIVVRMSDLRINASYIAKLISFSRTIVANLRDRLNTKAYEILRENRKR